MTTRDVLKLAGLLSVTLMSVTMGWASTRTTIGTEVADSVASTLRGGACNYVFFYDNKSPIYCNKGKVGCNGAQKPNTVEAGTGSAGSQESSCGGGDNCATTFSVEGGCAT